MKLLVPEDKIPEIKLEANEYISHTLTDRQLCDIELILNGGFKPLTGFMSKNDYNSVLKDMRLGDGTLWPIPINLDISKDTLNTLI